MSYAALTRYYHTIKPLKLKQIVYRVWYHCRPPRFNPPESMDVRQWRAPWSSPLPFPSCLSPEGTLTFLNKTVSLTDNYLWSDTHHERLWIYNLHYFDALNGAQSASNDSRWINYYLNEWIANNPPGKKNAWDPYPVSLRLVNWIKWFSKLETPDGQWLDSLALQAHFLSQRLEYHILGNHLFANAKALVFAGCYFTGAMADAWLNLGLDKLDKEIQAQFLKDGGHCERSPMYHAILLGDLCDLIQLANCTGLVHLTQRKAHWLMVLAHGLEWLAHMVHPDGEIAFFNDATLGIAPTLHELCCYAKTAGVAVHEPQDVFQLYSLPTSGYYSVALPNSGKAIIDLAELGPLYQPGHAHADTLSFELSLHGQRFLVNSGLSTYELGPLRQFQRSTKAHNTVVVNGKNSSDVWAGFRVGRRAKPRNCRSQVDAELITIQGEHDGYTQFSSHPIHRRRWEFTTDAMLVHDVITGEAVDAQALFYFHPEVQVEWRGPLRIDCYLTAGQRVQIEFSEAVTVSVKSATWYPGFAVSVPTVCLVVTIAGNELIARFTW